MIKFKKKHSLTPSEIIKSEQSKVEQAFGMFTKLRNDIAESIGNIQEAKNETHKRIESIKAQLLNEENVLQLADDEIQAQTGLLKRVEEFIPKGGNR